MEKYTGKQKLARMLAGNSITKPSGGDMNLNAGGCSSNNGSKFTPGLSADLWGDWREEVIFRCNNNSELRIFTTRFDTEYKFHTLMHDPQYRMAIAWQNVGYNQPPHPSFYLFGFRHGLSRPKIRYFRTRVYTCNEAFSALLFQRIRLCQHFQQRARWNTSGYQKWRESGSSRC